jgi:hypothetical protein
MSELDKIRRETDVIEIVHQSQVKKRKEHIGRMHVYPGQKLWELNLSTLQVTQVVFKDISVDIDGCLVKDYESKDGYFPVPVVALNRRNAERKFIVLAGKIAKSANEQK